MPADPGLKRTPLHDAHVAAGARLAPFAGWAMPVQYTGIIDEHRAVRSGVGIFDVSHLGRFAVAGLGSGAALQRVLTPDLESLMPGRSAYALLLNEAGRILDDLFVYQTGRDSFRLIVNAATTARDWAWLTERAAGAAECRWADDTAATAMIAVQGPAAVALLDGLTGGAVGDLPRHGNAPVTLAGIAAFAGRTGYTGEDGAEIVVAADRAREVWDALIQAGAKPCGLGARDTLRLEAAYPLYGNDIDESTTPIEAGLGWAVALDKGDFVGRTAVVAVQERGPARRLVGFVMTERGIARAGYPILAGGAEVGRVTSGSFAPTLNQNIALGYVPSGLARVGTDLAVVIRGQPVAARVVRRPFYKNV